MKRRPPSGGGKPGGRANLKGPQAALGAKSRDAKKPAKSAKSQIRDFQRLLKKAGDDAALRKSLEAKLAALEREHREAAQSALEQKLARRYHKVKFVERVKIERGIQKLRRAAAKMPGGQLPPADATRLAQLQDDLQYVLHFPKGEKYVSLLRQAAEPAAQAHVEAERARLRAMVKAQLAERALLADIDEGRSTGLPASSITAQAQGVRADTDAAEQSSSSGGEESGSDSEAGASSGDEAPDAQPPGQQQQQQQQTRRKQGKRPPAAKGPAAGSSVARQPAAEAARVAPAQQPAQPSQPAAAEATATTDQPFQDDFFLSADAEVPAPAPLAAAAPEQRPGKRKQTPQALAKQRPQPTRKPGPGPGSAPAAAKPRPKAGKPGKAQAAEQQPKRTRAEGGRKRRKKK